MTSFFRTAPLLSPGSVLAFFWLTRRLPADQPVDIDALESYAENSSELARLIRLAERRDAIRNLDAQLQ